MFLTILNIDIQQQKKHFKLYHQDCIHVLM